MKCKMVLILVALSLLVTLSACGKKSKEPENELVDESSGPREISLNSGWDYYKGNQNGFESVSFDSSAWAKVSLPHNTSLYTAEDKNGYKGISCYRRDFILDNSFKGKRIVLNFEGVMQKCEVYLNEQLIAEHCNGNIPFSIDITDTVKVGEENVLCVRTDSTPDESFTPGKEIPDFQYFGGIHRNVSLTVTDKIYIGNELLDDTAAGGGVFITAPGVSKESADVRAKVCVHNDSGEEKTIQLSTIVKFGGEVVAEAKSEAVINASESYTFNELITIETPHLWHPYTPDLYDVETSVYSDNVLCDTITTQYGIRSIEWTHEGLFINGEEFEARGANLHEDIFVLGNAIPDNEVYEEIKRLKNNGFDLIRMSHYPHSEAYYDACDKYGVLVINCMSGWQYFNSDESFVQSTYDELRTMIRTARNHPSIIAWETSLNESSYSNEWAEVVNLIAHEEYPVDGISRMWTCGWKTNSFDVAFGAAQHGIRDSADRTDKGVIISEYGDWDYGGSNSSSRKARELGDKAMLIQTSNHIESRILTENEDWYGADALWSYQDYAGFDAGMNYCGVTDMYRIDKFSAFFFRSQRDASVDMSQYGIDTGAMVFIANSLTDTSPSDVTIFSNCDSIELFADGVSLGVQTPDTEYYGPNSKRMISTENLPHPPFTFKAANNETTELVAIGYIDGEKVAEYTVKRPDAASKIILSTETAEPLYANGSDIRLVWASVADNNGTITVDDDRYLEFNVTNGYIIGYEKLNTRGGKIGVWVRADITGSDGTIIVKAVSDGIEAGTLEIPVKGCTEQLLTSGAGNEYAGMYENIFVKEEQYFGENIAKGKTCIASTENNGVELAGLATDGDDMTWWCADNNQPAPHWWQIDLEEKQSISTIRIYFEERNNTTYQFILQGSDDAVNWTNIADYSAADSPNGEKQIECGGFFRYLRMYDIKPDNNMWPTIAEFEVYAGSSSGSSDVAREKSAYASSCATDSEADFGNDGNPGRSWKPSEDDNAPCWYVDLESKHTISTIEISWNENESHSFLIELSDDGTNWAEVATYTSEGNELGTKLSIEGTARFVRVRFKEKTSGFNMFYVYN